MIFQDSASDRGDIASTFWHALPFWLVLVVFETALWLLLALKFRQPCAPVALAAGLTLGLAVPMSGLRGPIGAIVALLLTSLTCALVLYGQAAFHAARVLGLSAFQALADTGIDFARALLEGLLSPADWWLIASGLALAALFGFGAGANRKNRRRTTQNPA